VLAWVSWNTLKLQNHTVQMGDSNALKQGRCNLEIGGKMQASIYRPFWEGPFGIETSQRNVFKSNLFVALRPLCLTWKYSSGKSQHKIDHPKQDDSSNRMPSIWVCFCGSALSLWVCLCCYHLLLRSYMHCTSNISKHSQVFKLLFTPL